MLGFFKEKWRSWGMLWDLLHFYSSLWTSCTIAFKGIPLNAIQLNWFLVCDSKVWDIWWMSLCIVFYIVGVSSLSLIRICILREGPLILLLYLHYACWEERIGVEVGGLVGWDATEKGEFTLSIERDESKGWNWWFKGRKKLFRGGGQIFRNLDWWVGRQAERLHLGEKQRGLLMD